MPALLNTARRVSTQWGTRRLGPMTQSTRATEITLATGPSWWPKIGMLVLFFVCLAAGDWQLHRAAQSRNLAAEVEAKAHLPPLHLDQPTRITAASRYRRVMVSGVFESAGQILVDNQSFQGQAGYHVITPLRFASNEAPLLVNRGWVPMGPDRRVLPSVEPPSGPVEIGGVLDVVPGPRFSLGSASQPGPWWGNRWAYLDLDYYTKVMGSVLRPYVLLMNTKERYGYARFWSRFETLYYEKYHMHVGYAIQWFAFSALAFAGLIALARSERRRSRRTAKRCKTS